MSINTSTVLNLKRYANMIFAVKQLIEKNEVDEHEGISAILFEVFLALDKMSEELERSRAEEFRRNSG